MKPSTGKTRLEADATSQEAVDLSVLTPAIECADTASFLATLPPANRESLNEVPLDLVEVLSS